MKSYLVAEKISTLRSINLNCYKGTTGLRLLSTTHYKFQKSDSNSSPPQAVKLPLFGTAFESKWQNKVCFTDYKGDNLTYSQLGNKSLRLAMELKQLTGEEETRVAFLCHNDSTFPVTLWATWMANNVAVPLTAKHPANMLEYFIKHSDAKLVVTTSEHADKMKKITSAVNSRLYVVDFDSISSSPVDFPVKDYKSGYDTSDNALILFTSGTTGQPKGVLLTHQNIKAQVENICQAFEITSKDTMLHVLPLHHTHGVIHALISPLSVGARCHMMDKFDPSRIWSELLSSEVERPSVIMGVPTVYVKLLEEYEKTYAKTSSKVEFVKAVCKDRMRVMLSGSASLPVPVLEHWEKITAHRLVERYGMTEIGVALTNPLHGEQKPGYVGLPFQSVELRVADFNTRDKYTTLGEWKGTKMVGERKDEVTGDLIVKGPSVFKEYWKNPQATQKEFTHDRWFITGDTVQYVNGAFKILGRNTVDIIKSGGYKLSALEIETQLLGLNEIKDVSVVALPDSTWGQKVAAIIVWNGKELNLNELRDLAKTRLPAYACPAVIKSIDELPRNHLGKVNKKELAKIF